MVVIITFIVVIMEFLTLIEKPEARKLFGKKEIEIINKQLHGYELTQSEKNRLSRDIRKKFEFIKKVSKYQDEFKLKKGLYTQNMIEDALKIILNDQYNNKIKEIFLFGSFVSGNFIWRSDIDIGISGNFSKKEATEFRIRTLGQLPEKFDLQIFEFLPEKIQKSILKNKKILYCANK